MRALKRTIWGFILLLSATTAQADVKFGIAAEPYPPFTWKDASGQWVGWEIDLMNGVCERDARKLPNRGGVLGQHHSRA